MQVRLKRFFLVCGMSLSAATAIMEAQTVAISPGYTTVGVNATMQYSATVSGLSNRAVTWGINGIPGGNTRYGTISATGLYRAPATPPVDAVLVTAVAADRTTYGAMYVNVAASGPGITAVSPGSLTTGVSMVTLTGSGFLPGAFAWLGGVRYPTIFINSSTIKVILYQGVAGSASLQLQNPTSLLGPAYPMSFRDPGPPTILPLTASVNLGTTQQFTASGATGWTASVGTINANGLYTAPGTLAGGSSVTVTAQGPGGVASAIVTLVNPNPQRISPVSASVSLGARQQFTSAGATSWTATAGTVDARGLYTAPAGLPDSGTARVTATGPNGTVSADVTLIPPTPVVSGVGTGQLPLGIFTTTISGTGFISSSTALLNGSPLATTFANGVLNVTGFAPQSGLTGITVRNGGVVSAAFQVRVGVQNALATPSAARRLLEQAAFGPTPGEASHVQAVGLQGWLDEQFSMQQISNYSNITSSQGGMPAHFLTNAVNNADQLRQRVALALSEVFVTSLSKLIWNDNMVPFQNMLLADSFTNYRKIMEDVTLSAAMAQYLDMANNAKADPASGSLANENYAREVMQLFTIGSVMLNQDGTTQMDSNGVAIPAYTQATIQEFARVYTGWTYAAQPGQIFYWPNSVGGGNLMPYPAQHDFSAKRLLNGDVSPAGVSPQQDLDNALDSIFRHPNMGPFVAMQMIRKLVKSNPSPAYIARVASAFNNNGRGVRGDMQAIIKAVLMDPEARDNDQGGKDKPTDGHLLEPALYVAAMVRAFGGQMNDQNYFPSDLAAAGEDMFGSPSVFNYYSPEYLVPGSGVTGGEFQIFTPYTAILRANLAGSLMFSAYQNPVQSYGPGTTVDLSPFVALAATPSTLVDALDLTLTHGTMPSAMKTAVVTAVNADSAYGSVHQVQTAAYLILSSSFYNVWH